MKEFVLSNAVVSLAQFTSAIGSLWGLFVAATFAAAGFGISMDNRFTAPMALFLTFGYLAFALGHFYFIMHNVRAQQRISREILAYVAAADPPVTDFPETIRAICANESKAWASVVTHVVIDVCVLLIIWSRAV